MLSQRRRALVGRLRHRKTREREGLYLAEGARCVATVLDHEPDARFAVVSRSFDSDPASHPLRDRLERAGIETIAVESADFDRLAATRTPQGILLVCSEPPCPTTLASRRPMRVLVLDAVQDPGNVGTLIRVAAGFDLAAIFALDGTADPFGPKAVRASAGHVAGVPVHRCDWAAAAPLLAAAGAPILLASGEGQDVSAGRAPGDWALVLGNEGAGIRSDIEAAAVDRVAVPLAGDVDSLNVAVAGAILMFALTRPRQQGSS